MGAHLIEGEFQYKYPTTPRGKVPLSVKDRSAQDLLWEYAQRRRSVDAEFSADLEAALLTAGFQASPKQPAPQEPPLPSNGFKSGTVGSRCGATVGSMRCSLTAGHDPLHWHSHPDGTIIEWSDGGGPRKQPLRCGSRFVEPTLVWVCGRLHGHEGPCSPVRETKS